MIHSKHRTKKGSRVVLKPDVADVYISAFGGSEGWVRGQRTEMGFPMVYIEWDKSHWTYNGEGDMWTFEDHFDIVDEDAPMTDNTPEPTNEPNRDAIKSALETLTEALLRDKERQPAPPEIHPPEDAIELGATMVHSDTDDADEYIENVSSAHQVASEGDAFFLISVTSRPDPSNPEGVALIPHVISSYQTPVAGLFLELQLSHLAAVAHEQSNLEMMRRLHPKKD